MWTSCRRVAFLTWMDRTRYPHLSQLDHYPTFTRHLAATGGTCPWKGESALTREWNSDLFCGVLWTSWTGASHCNPATALVKLEHGGRADYSKTWGIWDDNKVSTHPCVRVSLSFRPVLMVLPRPQPGYAWLPTWPSLAHPIRSYLRDFWENVKCSPTDFINNTL